MIFNDHNNRYVQWTDDKIVPLENIILRFYHYVLSLFVLNGHYHYECCNTEMDFVKLVINRKSFCITFRKRASIMLCTKLLTVTTVPTTTLTVPTTTVPTLSTTVLAMATRTVPMATRTPTTTLLDTVVVTTLTPTTTVMDPTVLSKPQW